MPRTRLASRTLLVTGCLLAGLSGSSVHAKSLAGRVLDVEQDGLYIDLGRRNGLALSDEITILVGKQQRRRGRVVALYRRGARVVLSGDGVLPRTGDRVRATGRAASAAKPTPPRVKQLPTPRTDEQIDWSELESNDAPWVAYRASAQAPARAATAGNRAVFRVYYGGAFNLSDLAQRHYQQIAISSDLDLPSLAGGYLSYSHRLRLQFDIAGDKDVRPYSAGRPVLRVHRLRAGLHLGPFAAQLGRFLPMPLAEAPLIDGGAAQARIGRLVTVGAFGGLQPGALNLRPAAEASAFGAFVALDGGTSWRYRAAVAVLGSTFDGAIDRRAAALEGSLVGPTTSIYTRGTLELFAADNAFGRSTVSLSAASVDLESKATDWLRLRGRFDYFRLTPTRELLELLPEDIFNLPATLSARGGAIFELSSWDLAAEFGVEQQSQQPMTFWSELSSGLNGLFGEADRLQLSALFAASLPLYNVGGGIDYRFAIGERSSASLRYALYRGIYRDEVASTAWSHYASATLDTHLASRLMLGTECAFETSTTHRLLLVLATLSYRL
ncbi:MAG: hypothetical protein H6707_17535 [Deltaproteobacteria bacterium]|nr:hypothetical protein [Deltaproteobacteria bacterium]